MSEGGFDISLLGLEGWEGAGAVGLAVTVGPSLRQIGRIAADWTDYRLRNLLKIGEKANRKLGDRRDEPGGVHPRMAHELLEEGSWVDDEVHQEYLAGLLASARNGDGRDSYAGYLTRVTRNLSSDHVRLHHIIYSALHGVGTSATSGRDMRTNNGRRRLGVYVHEDELAELFPQPKRSEILHYVGGLAESLARENLIEPSPWAAGPASILQIPAPPGPGLAVTPTGIGAELLLHAYGNPTSDPNDLLRGVVLDPFDPPGPRAVAPLVRPMPLLPGLP